MRRRESMTGGGSPAAILRRVSCAVSVVRAALAASAAAVAIAAAPAAADARDSAYAAERRVLESARYLHEIEGDERAARALLDRLSRSSLDAIRAQARYLDARFLEERNDLAGAARRYREALEGEGLEPAQKQRAVARLLALDPASVHPFRDAGRTGGLPAQVFETATPSGSEYVLVGERDDAGATPRLWRQDRRGLLTPLEARLGPDEEVLDATPSRVLTRVAARQRVILRRAPAFEPEVILERFVADDGSLLQGHPDEVLLVGAQGVRHMRGGALLFAYESPGAACTWHAAYPRARQGVLFCPEQGVLRADFSRRSVTPIALGGERPSGVILAGEHLVLRYVDHMEVRRGPAFDAFLWGFPAGLQDPVAVGGQHLFLATADGSLRAFSLRTGQPDWQREDGVSALEAHGNELFVLTHARVLLAVDRRGRLLYSYEPGWAEEEPVLLPGRDWLVVHNADGRRIRLNRELLRLTGGRRTHLLRAERESLRRGDVAAALRELDAVLALEPGSGEAWREKARLLETSGAARELRTQAWLQAARSQSAAPWSADPAFAELADGLGASWAWKRQPGPRFFPSLAGGRNFSFYVENDNQTLVVLDTRSGALKGTFRFPEDLDLKVALWAGDTLAVSSAGRIHLVTPLRAPGVLAQIGLRAPVCHAVMLPQGLLLSDWNGNVRLLDLATREAIWDAKIGRGGVLFAPTDDGGVDAFEIEGAWHRLDPEDGRSLASARLPQGTITEVHAGTETAYAGYNEGRIVAVDRASGAITWQRDLGEQLFSLAGRGDRLLLAGTASRRVVNLNGRSGAVQSQAVVPSHLFNRPLLTADGYWVGTTEPALEKRSFVHEVIEKHRLPDLPGTPTRAGNGIAVSTLDHFILLFPDR